MSLRIIAGQFKGRILKTPKGSATRPTQEILRGVIFNICQNEIHGAYFLDLFAGSGAMGLEALSRGAKHTTFIENNRNAIATIRENIATLQIAMQTTLICSSAKAGLLQLKEPFDVIYVDPPYEVPTAPFTKQIIECNLIRPNGFLFIEEANQNSSPLSLPSLQWISSRRFGSTALHHYQKLST